MSSYPGHELLREVSRSFYISIRLLPQSLRQPIGLAYMLARTSDTIADVGGIEVHRRIQLLDQFAAAVAGLNSSAGKQIRDLIDSRPDPHPTEEMTKGERALLKASDVHLQELEALPIDDRTDVRRLLDTIIKGQRSDLVRGEHGFGAVQDGKELREYTYSVAGCVGEFWTRICFRKISAFTARPEAEMVELGRLYGSGLQLLNILRDAGEDLRRGRCYFPADELRAEGVLPQELLTRPSALLPVYRRWLAEAGVGVRAGIEYAVAINRRAVRIASAVPALIGMRTLRLLEQAGLEVLERRIKIPRSEVRGILAALTITLGNRGFIARSLSSFTSTSHPEVRVSGQHRPLSYRK